MATGSMLQTVIGTAPWSQVLTAEERVRVQMEVSLHTTRKGGYLCRRGDPADHWYGLAGGLMKLCNVQPSGKVATVCCIPPGTWFGEESLLRDEVRCYDVIALRDSVIACLPRQSFFRLLDNNPRFTRCVLTLLNERLAQFFGASGDQRAKERLARCLASFLNPVLYPTAGSKLKFSQEELGSLVGLSRQRVNACLKSLEEDGILRAQYGAISIIDLNGLRRIGT